MKFHVDLKIYKYNVEYRGKWAIPDLSASVTSPQAWYSSTAWQNPSFNTDGNGGLALAGGAIPKVDGKCPDFQVDVHMPEDVLVSEIQFVNSAIYETTGKFRLYFS